MKAKRSIIMWHVLYIYKNALNSIEYIKYNWYREVETYTKGL